MILDEATSTLESCEEKQVHQLILSTLANSTVITVTHRLAGHKPDKYQIVVKTTTRLAAVLDYDRALVVGEGRVLEDGPPKELLARPMGFFSALYRWRCWWRWRW